mmetsp:Transcript_18831/g.43410  ORF Transcript_18831/g.43410 Transcript_18831/m.43410 type:complete len:257 (+) Transcript_18831:2031-2801(+)
MRDGVQESQVFAGKVLEWDGFQKLAHSRSAFAIHGVSLVFDPFQLIFDRQKNDLAFGFGFGLGGSEATASNGIFFFFLLLLLLLLFVGLLQEFFRNLVFQDLHLLHVIHRCFCICHDHGAPSRSLHGSSDAFGVVVNRGNDVPFLALDMVMDSHGHGRPQPLEFVALVVSLALALVAKDSLQRPVADFLARKHLSGDGTEASQDHTQIVAVAFLVGFPVGFGGLRDVCRVIQLLLVEFESRRNCTKGTRDARDRDP